jgi:hypothetical protein
VSETTIRDLIERLEEAAQEHGDDTPIRIAEQPTYPLQNYIDDDLRFWKGVLYIKHGSQVGGYSYDDATVPNNSPYLPKHIFGDPPEEVCESCQSYNVVGTVALGGDQDRESVCEHCLITRVPEEVVETYVGDLPMQRIMDLRRRAGTPNPSV